MLQFAVIGGRISTLPIFFTTTGEGVPQGPMRIAGPTVTSAMIGARSSIHRARAASTSSVLHVIGGCGASSTVEDFDSARGVAMAGAAPDLRDVSGAVFGSPLLFVLALAAVLLSSLSFVPLVSFFSLVRMSFVRLSFARMSFGRGSATSCSRGDAFAFACAGDCNAGFWGRCASSARSALEAQAREATAAASAKIALIRPMAVRRLTFNATLRFASRSRRTSLQHSAGNVGPHCSSSLRSLKDPTIRVQQFEPADNAQPRLSSSPRTSAPTLRTRWSLIPHGYPASIGGWKRS